MTVELPEHLKQAAASPEGKRMRALMAGLAPVIAEHVKAEVAKATAPLKAEIAELRKHAKYAGIWREGSYTEGSIVTHGGTLWHCCRTTGQKPGSSDEWKLMLKHAKGPR